MSQIFDILPAGNGFRAGFARFGSIFAEALWRHRFIHGLALAILTLSLAVGTVAGNQPDIDIVWVFCLYVSYALLVGGGVGAALHLVWLARVARDPAPLRAFGRRLLKVFSNAESWANGFNGIVAFMIFVAGFSVLKGAITYFAPFSWDQWLANTERSMHFGKLPYEWLWWLTGSPKVVFLLNFFYNFWYIATLGITFSACITERDNRLRHVYLLSFMLLWVVGGFFIAMLFSSAGPCFYAPLGLGNTYQPLMDALGRANQSYPIWALSTQDMLWSGYKGLRNGDLGISAFPSLHTGTAMLIALYASARWRWAKGIAWAFTLIIIVGSIVLGWHYALDAYAGAAIAAAIWYCVRAVSDRLTPATLPER